MTDSDSKYAEEERLFFESLARTTPLIFIWPTIIALNVLVFGRMLLAGVSPAGPTAAQLVEFGANYGPYTLNGEWLRLLTSMFVHVDVAHISLNMLFVWRLGRLAEPIYGNWVFLTIYILSGLVGSLTSVSWTPTIVGAGASGALFGIAGALVAFFYLDAESVPDDLRSGWRRTLLFFVGVNVSFGLADTQIDNAAHLGGLLAGSSAGVLLHRPLGASRPGLGRRYPLAVLVGASFLVLAGHAAQKNSGDLPVDIARTSDPDRKDVEADRRNEKERRAPDSDRELAKTYENSGFLYAQQGRYQEAISSYQKPLEITPDNRAMRLALGLAYDAKGDYKEAIAAYEKASVIDRDLGIQPENTEAYSKAAWLYATAEEPELRDPWLAILFANRAVQLGGESVPAHHFDTLAEAHYVNNNLDKAIAFEKRAIAMRPDYEPFKDRLRKFEQAKRAQAER